MSKRCKTCKHFKKAGYLSSGWRCDAPVPCWVYRDFNVDDGEIHSDVRWNEGSRCDCWEGKP